MNKTLERLIGSLGELSGIMVVLSLLLLFFGGLAIGVMAGVNFSEIVNVTCEFSIEGHFDLNTTNQNTFNEATITSIDAKIPCGRVYNAAQIGENFRKLFEVKG